MDRAVVVEVLLDAEVAESALVERVLVDSAALVGGTLVVNLVLKACNGTERTGLAVAVRLCSFAILPDCSVEVVTILVSPVIVLSNLIHVPVFLGGTTLLPITGDLKWSSSLVPPPGSASSPDWAAAMAAIAATARNWRMLLFSRVSFLFFYGFA